MTQAKRVGIVSTAPNGRIDNPDQRKTSELYDMCGHNVGNLAFWGAVSSYVADDKVFFGWNFDPAEVNEKVDVLVFPAANQLNPRFDLGSFSERFEKVKVPLVIVGLGAQAEAYGRPVELKDGTARWLKVVAERTKTIGSRGVFSAEVMSNYGVKNVEVIGCPSFFLNPRNDLGAVLSSKMKAAYGRISINQGDVPDNVWKAEQMLATHAARPESQYVVQAPSFWISLALGRFEELNAAERDRYASLFPEGGKRPSVYFNFADWIGSLKSYDLSIGTRIHGNILALQAEIPAICIDHDSRTRELSETIGMPREAIREFMKYESVEAFVAAYCFSWENFDQNRNELKSRLVRIFEAEAIAHNL